MIRRQECHGAGKPVPFDVISVMYYATFGEASYFGRLTRVVWHIT